MTIPKAFIYIGGSYPQIRAFEAIKNLGITTILTDRSPNPPLKSLADHFFQIDATDVEAFIRLGDDISEKFDLIGVYPIEDYAVLSATALAEKFKIPYFDKFTAHIFLNKYESHNVWTSNGISTPDSILIKSGLNFVDLNTDILTKLTLPIIIKPVTSWGSQGVNVLYENDQYEFSRLITMSRRFSDDLIVQEYINGTIHNVDGVFLKNIYYPCNSYDRLPNPRFQNVTSTILEPSELENHIIDEMHFVLKKACNLIGLENGPVTGDFVFLDEDLYLLEISPHFHSVHQTSMRMNGTHYPMKSWIAYLSGCLNPQNILKESHLPGTSGLSSAWSDATGGISKILIDNRIYENTLIEDVHIRNQKGDKLATNDGILNCIALIWGFSEDRNALLTSMDEASQLIKVETVE